MPISRAAIRVIPASADQDRVAHRVLDTEETVVLADGAAGVGGSREAADLITSRELPSLRDPLDCVAALRVLDHELSTERSCGESTAVLLVLRDDKFFGASVGDSGVWALTTDAIFDLTRAQHRKPLLGTGSAEPVGFGPLFFSDRLLIASDGILKYAPRARIRAAAFVADIHAAADAIVAAARLPNGALQDDVALALLDPQWRWPTV